MNQRQRDDLLEGGANKANANERRKAVNALLACGVLFPNWVAS